MSQGECVRVMVRCRPQNTREKNKGCSKVVQVDKNYNQILLFKPESKEIPKTFAYDAVYGEDSQQQTVYDESAFSLVESVAATSTITATSAPKT